MAVWHSRRGKSIFLIRPIRATLSRMHFFRATLNTLRTGCSCILTHFECRDAMAEEDEDEEAEEEEDDDEEKRRRTRRRLY
jgi:hypothetical protein